MPKGIYPHKETRAHPYIFHDIDYKCPEGFDTDVLDNYPRYIWSPIDKTHGKFIQVNKVRKWKPLKNEIHVQL